MEFFKKNHFFEKISRFRFQRALNHPQTLSLSQVMQENVIMPKYVNSAPSSQKWNFSKKNHFFEKVPRFRFQRALNHPQTLSLSQVMQENVIMPKYGNSAPCSQKWNFSKNFIFLKRSSNFASNEPSTTYSYTKKHIIKKVESRIQLLNPEWRSYQSFT